MSPPTICIITPTTGNEKLLRAISSIKNQTYKKVKHLIVVDGRTSQLNIQELENHSLPLPYGCDINDLNPNIEIVNLRTNVGGKGFYGHRVYAAFPHLVNEEYVFLLDQDNTFEPNHVETLVETIQSKGLDWAHSLRNIYDKDDKFLCKDDCESLGQWPVWNDPNSFHIDTSAYAFRREFLIQVCQHWHFGYAGDRRFYHILKQCHTKYDTSGKYTLNYFLDGNPTSASPDFFLAGNKSQQSKPQYSGVFPWSKENVNVQA